MKPPLTESIDIQGHRGARGLLPENTIPAFIRALELGVTTLEMDTVINAEGHVVVSHEPWMSALICSHPDGRPVQKQEERSLNIYRMDDSEMAGFDCGSRQHPDFPEQQTIAVPKPLLADLFSAVERFETSKTGAPVRFNIEIKSRPEWDEIYHPDVSRFALLLYQVVNQFGLVERTSIQSFDPRALEAVHQIDPDIETVWLISNRDGLTKNLARLSFSPTIYSPDYRLVDQALVDRLRALGIRLIPWTVNRPKDMMKLAGLGVEGLITDYPDVAIDVLRSME